MSKYHRSLCVTLSRTDAGLCIYHFFFVCSNFNFLHISQWITLPTQSCLVLYSFCANLLHSLITRLMVSSQSPHNQHLPFCCVLLLLIKSFSHQFLYHTYIFIDASGWVINDVSFGFMGGFGSCNIRPPHPNDPVGIDLTPTPILVAKLRIHTRKKNDHKNGSIYNFATANQS